MYCQWVRALAFGRTAALTQYWRKENSRWLRCEQRTNHATIMIVFGKLFRPWAPRFLAARPVLAKGASHSSDLQSTFVVFSFSPLIMAICCALPHLILHDTPMNTRSRTTEPGGRW